MSRPIAPGWRSLRYAAPGDSARLQALGANLRRAVQATLDSPRRGTFLGYLALAVALAVGGTWLAERVLVRALPARLPAAGPAAVRRGAPAWVSPRSAKGGGARPPRHAFHAVGQRGEQHGHQHRREHQHQHMRELIGGQARHDHAQHHEQALHEVPVGERRWWRRWRHTTAR